MPDLIYLLAVLACPVGMGMMMLMMMRGNHRNQSNQGSGADTDEVAQLRAEVERLRTRRPRDSSRGDSSPVDQTPTAP